MDDERDFGAELDWLKTQVALLQEQVGRTPGGRPGGPPAAPAAAGVKSEVPEPESGHGGLRGTLHYAGTFGQDEALLKWEAQERAVDSLLQFDSERAAKILAALGHKQRLDILRALLVRPQSGASLVEQLQMGTTGQLYHHIKAMAGADLLRQEDRGGAYVVQTRRLLPILLLLAAANDLDDTSDYIDMTTVRDRAGDYIGSPGDTGGQDPHVLLWAVLENSLAEHEAGHCSDVHLFLHGDSVTVADNGRGIPTSALGGTGRTWLHSVMTDLRQLAIQGAQATVPGSAKPIRIAVVNAMSARLQVEVRRDGRISTLGFKHGIPQHPLSAIGVTGETGTSITFEPDPELFAGRFDRGRIEARADAVRAAYPALRLHVHD